MCLAACTALACWLAVPARAQEETATLDPSRTIVSFTLRDVLHTVHGSFALKYGRLTFDRASRKIAGELAVDATSGDSGNKGRDRRMHAEILESNEFREIVFEPAEWSGELQSSGDSRLIIRGRFKMHGKEQQVEMPAEIHIQGRDLMADLKFPLTYVEWGVKNPSTFLLRVSDMVQIEVHAVATVAGSETN